MRLSRNVSADEDGLARPGGDVSLVKWDCTRLAGGERTSFNDASSYGFSQETFLSGVHGMFSLDGKACH